MTLLQSLFQHLVVKRKSALADWLAEYKQLTAQVARIREQLQGNASLQNPEAYVGTEFEGLNAFNVFARKLIFEKSNGVLSKGLSLLNEDTFDKLIADATFVGALEALIREPKHENYLAFGEAWRTVGQRNNPVIINRTAAACTTALSTTGDENNFAKASPRF